MSATTEETTRTSRARSKAAEEAPAEVKPDPEEEYITPKDTVDALRMIRKLGLLEADDDADVRKHVTNIVVTWISQKRAGTTNQDFETWYTTADPFSPGDDEEDVSDPT